jgi:hypothetical protein
MLEAIEPVADLGPTIVTGFGPPISSSNRSA